VVLPFERLGITLSSPRRLRARAMPPSGHRRPARGAVAVEGCGAPGPFACWWERFAAMDLLDALVTESGRGVGLVLVAGEAGLGVLVPREDGVAYRHELLRIAVESSLPAVRRALLPGVDGAPV
jgi:hypothetical protein